jgi:hypothetical protein
VRGSSLNSKRSMNGTGNGLPYTISHTLAIFDCSTVGRGDIGGHVLRETTIRGLCGLCPSRTSERGGEGDCVKEGGGGEGKCERERALERLRCYS